MENIIFYCNNLLNKNNHNHKEKDIYEKNLSTLKLNEIEDIRKRYKIIDVKWIDKSQINYAMFGDDYFNLSKTKIINNMLEHYLTDKDKEIYEKKINYICNKKEKICICNINANNFRKIYDDINYKDEIYISWIKKCDEPF
jgi:hypothetical protein